MYRQSIPHPLKFNYIIISACRRLGGVTFASKIGSSSLSPDLKFGNW